MKKLLLIIFISLSLIGLIGCGKKNSNNGNKTEIKINNTTIKSNIKDEKISYNKDKKELKIGNSVTIKPGKPKNLPKDLPLIDGITTYINSNVPNYFFYVIKGQTAEKPGKWFLDELNKKGYLLTSNNDIDPEKDKETKINYNNMEFMKKDKDGNIIQKFNISIYPNTPENIKKGLGLEGLFIEIYY